MFLILSHLLCESKAATHDIKYNTLFALKNLLRFQLVKPPLLHIRDDLKSILDICQKNFNHEFFKITAEAFKCIAMVFKIIAHFFPNELNYFSAKITPLSDIIIQKLQLTDVDQDIKHSVVHCASNLLRHLSPLITGP